MPTTPLAMVSELNGFLARLKIEEEKVFNVPGQIASHSASSSFDRQSIRLLLRGILIVELYHVDRPEEISQRRDQLGEFVPVLGLTLLLYARGAKTNGSISRD